MDYTKIKALREKEHMTQGDLAKALDIQDRTVRNWENGTSKPIPFLSKISDLFFGGNMDALNTYFSDEPENWDFSRENQMLNGALESGTIAPIYASVLKPLFECGKQDAVGVALCSFLGCYRHTPPASNYYYYLSELAAYVRKATSIRSGAEFEMLTHDLISQLSHYQSCNNLPVESRQQVREIIIAMQKVRHISSDTELVYSLQRCFFCLYDNFDALSALPNYYDTLSAIVAPLEGVAPYSEAECKHLFYTLFQCAVDLTAKRGVEN